MHLACRNHVHAPAPPRGVGRCTGPATRVTSAPASRAARAMAKPILPLEWLVMPRTGSIASKVGPAVTSTCWPTRVFGDQVGDQFLEQFPGLQHAAVAELATGLVAAGHAPAPGRPSAAIWRTLRWVAGWAHISRFMAGAMSSGARPIGRARHSSAQQLVGPALHQLRDEVGAGRGNHDGIGLAAQVDVRHVVVRPRVPLRAVHRPARQRLHGHGCHELAGRFGHHHLHRGAGLGQQAAELGRLEAGHTARQPQHDMFPANSPAMSFAFMAGNVAEAARPTQRQPRPGRAFIIRISHLTEAPQPPS
jgi:hypothetical protein